MGRGHTRKARIGRLGGTDYTLPPPKGAERRLGPLFLKLVRGKVFSYQNDWRRDTTVSSEEFEGAEKIERKLTLKEINEDLLKRIEASK